MKRTIRLAIILISATFLNLACSKDSDDNRPDPGQAVIDIQAYIVEGEWEISSFVDSGTDETAHFADFTFTFASDGVISASGTTEMLTGAWILAEDDKDSMDTSDDIAEITLVFGVPETHDFSDLNEDWEVMGYTTTAITLRDISGGSGEIDTLVFTRK